MKKPVGTRLSGASFAIVIMIVAIAFVVTIWIAHWIHSL